MPQLYPHEILSCAVSVIVPDVIPTPFFPVNVTTVAIASSFGQASNTITIATIAQKQSIVNLRVEVHPVVKRMPNCFNLFLSIHIIVKLPAGGTLVPVVSLKIILVANTIAVDASRLRSARLVSHSSPLHYLLNYVHCPMLRIILHRNWPQFCRVQSLLLSIWCLLARQRKSP